MDKDFPRGFNPSTFGFSWELATTFKEALADGTMDTALLDRALRFSTNARLCRVCEHDASLPRAAACAVAEAIRRGRPRAFLEEALSLRPEGGPIPRFAAGLGATLFSRNEAPFVESTDLPPWFADAFAGCPTTEMTSPVAWELQRTLSSDYQFVITDQPDLERLVEKLGYNLRLIANVSQGLDRAIADLLRHCARAGRLWELVDAARAFRPSNYGLQAFTAKFRKG